MRKKAIETVLGICLLISGMFIPMKNVEAFDTYTASLAESEVILLMIGIRNKEETIRRY